MQTGVHGDEGSKEELTQTADSFDIQPTIYPSELEKSSRKVRSTLVKKGVTFIGQGARFAEAALNHGSTLAEKTKQFIPALDPEIQRRLDLRKGYSIKAMFDRAQLQVLQARTDTLGKFWPKFSQL